MEDGTAEEHQGEEAATAHAEEGHSDDTHAKAEDDHGKEGEHHYVFTGQPGVCHLTVTGVLERDGKVLLGLRSLESGVHPGVWKFVPSDGMEVPMVDLLTSNTFLAQLIDKLNEEIAG